MATTTATPLRDAVLAAALRSFAERGYEAMTIEHLRAGSGASTGSIYHHFGDKQGVAAALYVEGLRAYQDGLLATLERARSARDGVRALVRHHLRWVDANQDLARFLFSRAGGESAPAARDEVRALNRHAFATVDAWLQRHVQAGALRPLPPDLAFPVLLGPAQEHARHVLAGRARTSLRAAERHLAAAAWAAVAAHPDPEESR